MPTPRFGHVAGVATDAAGQPTLYVFGGQDGEVDGFHTLEAYNPATDTWKTLSMISATTDEVSYYNGIGKIGNKLYLAGGDVETGNGNKHMRVLQVYDPAQDIWTRKGRHAAGQ